MKFTPLPQQQILIDAFLKHKEVAALADPGLGKTASVLSACCRMIQQGRSKGVLIIAPLRVCTLVWPQEVQRWDQFQWMKVADLRTEEGMDSWRNESAHVYIINYEMLISRSYAGKPGKPARKSPGFIEKYLKTPASLPVDTIVWDEISRMRDQSTKSVKQFSTVRSRFLRHFGLTGTPAPNSYLDLFSIFKTLDGGKSLGPVFTAFRDRYFQSDYMGYVWTIRPGAKEEIENRINGITYTLRASDYLHIPPTSFIDIDTPLPPDAKKLYKTLEKQLLIEIKNKTVLAVNAAVLAGKLLQITGGSVYAEDGATQIIHSAKIDALRKLLKQDNNSPILVFSSYIHEKQRILKEIPEAVIFEDSLVEMWNAGKIKLLLADPRSVGHGLNLQSGGYRVCWFGPTYSRELYDQGNARLVRTGQDKPTIVYRLIAPGTIDDAVVEVLRVKGDSQSGLKAALKNLELLRDTGD